MSEDDAFRELIRRVRAGDHAAAAELVRVSEPAIRRAARIRLTDPALRRLFDSMDVCQSVFSSFFSGPHSASSSWTRRNGCWGCWSA